VGSIYWWRVSKVVVIDSGIGGLSFVKRLRASASCLDIIYIADTVFFPYGDKSPEEIGERVLQLTEMHRADAYVLACNTATALAIDRLREQTPIPVVGIEPPIVPAAKYSKQRRVGIWCTPGTAESERLKRLIQRNQHSSDFITIPCAGLADAIENEQAHLNELIEEFTIPLKEFGADVLALGCTHYELIAEQIEFKSGLPTLSPSDGAVRRLLSLMPDVGKGQLELHSTSEQASIERAAARWLS
jgi:glutamate racemase